MASPTPPTTNVKYLPRHDDTEQRLLVKIAAALTVGIGLGGSDYVSDATSHTGNWLILHAIEDTVISSLTYRSGTRGGASLAGKTIKAGDRLYGEIVSIQLTSGSVELYRATLG